MPDRPAVVVLISGSGTTMAAVLAAAADPAYPARVAAVDLPELARDLDTPADLDRETRPIGN